MPNSNARIPPTVPSKIIDVVDQALRARLLGGSTFNSGFDSLDSVLNLQFRLHYHVIGSNGPAKPVCDVLLKESQNLEKNMSMMEELNDYPEITKLVEKILFNCLGILFFHRGQFQESQRCLLHSLKIHNNTASQRTALMEQYDRYLIVENLYYRGLGFARHKYHAKCFLQRTTGPRGYDPSRIKRSSFRIHQLDRRKTQVQSNSGFSRKF